MQPVHTAAPLLAAPLLAALLLVALPAHADNAADARRAVMERDRMSEDFARSLRQDRLRMDVPAGDARRTQSLEQQIIRQNQAADALGARQDLEMRTRRGGAGQAEYDAQRFGAERRAGEAQATQEADVLRQDEAARARREAPAGHTPTLEAPVRWGPSL
jgi:hypothetical protein